MSSKKKASRSTGRKRILNQQSRKGVAENKFGVVKSARISACMTPEGKERLKALSQRHGCSSLSEFLELLAREELCLENTQKVASTTILTLKLTRSSS